MTDDDRQDTNREILARLIELTPEPPAETAAGELEVLLTTFEAIVAARAEVLARLAPPLRLAEADRPLLVELERRQALWQDTLAAALRLIGDQRCATGKLRAYAPVP